MSTPILSLDGGGLLGILPLSILRYLENTLGKPTSSLFRLISGVSTGGIIALGLSVPKKGTNDPRYSAQDILSFYKTHSATVFQRSLLSRLCASSHTLETLHQIFFSKYQSIGIETCFKELFEGCTLSQALTNVIVPSYNLADTGKKEARLKMFASYKAGLLSFKGSYLMADVARATSAAPTYFPPKSLKRRDREGHIRETLPSYCLVDGALAAHDPSLVAYAEAQNLFGPRAPLLIVSLGTAMSLCPYRMLVKRRSPGVLSWQRVIARLLLDLGRSSHQAILHRLLHGDPDTLYYRFLPREDSSPYAFDDISAKHIAYLENQAHHLMHDRWANPLAELVARLK